MSSRQPAKTHRPVRLHVLGLGLLMLVSACSNGSKVDTAARDRCEAKWGVGNCVERSRKWVPLAAATSTTATTEPATTTTRPPATTTAPPTTTTTAAAPAVEPVDQLADLRAYYAGEPCRASLPIINSPRLPEDVKQALAESSTDWVSDEGVIGVVDSSYTRWYFLSSERASEVTAEFYRSFQPGPVDGAWHHGILNRGADGQFICEEYTYELGSGD